MKAEHCERSMCAVHIFQIIRAVVVRSAHFISLRSSKKLYPLPFRSPHRFAPATAPIPPRFCKDVICGRGGILGRFPSEQRGFTRGQRCRRKKPHEAARVVNVLQKKQHHIDTHKHNGENQCEKVVDSEAFCNHVFFFGASHSVCLNQHEKNQQDAEHCR